jgi:DNA-binding NarL/FixJ family response regulator
LISEAPDGVGYLLKDRIADVSAIVDALRRLSEGDCVVDPTIVSRLMRRARQSRPLDRLSPRERDVLGLMAEGRSNGGIARHLGSTLKTAETYVAQVLTKLDIPSGPDDHRRILAVLRYLASDSPP